MQQVWTHHWLVIIEPVWADLLREWKEVAVLEAWRERILTTLVISKHEAGCSQEEGPKKGFVLGSRTQGVQEILEIYI